MQGPFLLPTTAATERGPPMQGVGRGVPPSRCSLNRGGSVAPEPLRNRTPPTLYRRKVFRDLLLQSRSRQCFGHRSDPCVYWTLKKFKIFSCVQSRGCSPPCRQATRRPRRVSSSSCASRVRMRARSGGPAPCPRACAAPRACACVLAYVRVRARYWETLVFPVCLSFPFPFLYRGVQGGSSLFPSAFF